MSINDQQVIERWDTTTCFEKGHYVMDIPFKDNKKCLPNNARMAESRLQSLAKKLNKDPQLKSHYIAGMNDLFAKGYAKEVSHEEMEGKHGEVWYLPHHPVINPQKEKVRIVFDCAAKYNGVSLNSRVLQGPDLANKLVGVLIRFRLEEVALMADIEAMFHQVKVSPCDQDVLRFLWWPEGDTTQKPQVCKMLVHLFGWNLEPKLL